MLGLQNDCFAKKLHPNFHFILHNCILSYLHTCIVLYRCIHPALSNLITTHDVKMSRSHIKFLSGNYLTYSIKAKQSGGSPHCKICPVPSCDETYSHIISSCHGMAVEREKLLSDMKILCSNSRSSINFDKIVEDEKSLCQFVLDPTSLNLPTRVQLNDPLLGDFFRLSRDYCHLMDKIRTRLLKEKSKIS